MSVWLKITPLRSQSVGVRHLPRVLHDHCAGKLGSIWSLVI